MSDHTISMLRLLIANDFKYRHGTRDIDVWQYALTVRKPPVLSKHWWDHEFRRLDIARLRSYISAVRVLEQSETKVTGCGGCPFVNRDDWFGEPDGCNISDASVSQKGPPPESCPLRAGTVTIRLVTKGE